MGAEGDSVATDLRRRTRTPFLQTHWEQAPCQRLWTVSGEAPNPSEAECSTRMCACAHLSHAPVFRVAYSPGVAAGAQGARRLTSPMPTAPSWSRSPSVLR